MARKKKAPAIKSNLRDVPADKFRAVNRMNGIVTMVEYSSEDDIKAYELEPTFRELGGGGGVEINNPTLTINYHQQWAPGAGGDLSNVMFLNIFQAPSQQQQIPASLVALYNNAISFNCPMPNESGTVEMYILPTTTTAVVFSDNVTDITSANANNCQLITQQGITLIMVLNNHENASIDLTYKIGGGGE